MVDSIINYFNEKHQKSLRLSSTNLSRNPTKQMNYNFEDYLREPMQQP